MVGNVVEVGLKVVPDAVGVVGLEEGDACLPCVEDSSEGGGS